MATQSSSCQTKWPGIFPSIICVNTLLIIDSTPAPNEHIVVVKRLACKLQQLYGLLDYSVQRLTANLGSIKAYRPAKVNVGALHWPQHTKLAHANSPNFAHNPALLHCKRWPAVSHAALK